MEQEFPYSWRFDDERYNLLPLADRSYISPIPAAESEAIWESIFEVELSHLMKLTHETRIGWVCIKEASVDTDEYDVGVHILNSYAITARDVIFFWSSTNAVKTKWSVFVKYWNDFCYPSDDNNLIYIDSHTMLVFVEETFALYSRIK